MYYRFILCWIFIFFSTLSTSWKIQMLVLSFSDKSSRPLKSFEQLLQRFYHSLIHVSILYKKRIFSKYSLERFFKELTNSFQCVARIFWWATLKRSTSLVWTLSRYKSATFWATLNWQMTVSWNCLRKFWESEANNWMMRVK